MREIKTADVVSVGPNRKMVMDGDRVKVRNQYNTKPGDLESVHSIVARLFNIPKKATRCRANVREIVERFSLRKFDERRAKENANR